MPGGCVVDKLTSALLEEGPGPIVTVPKATITTKLDAAGQITLTMPAPDRRTALIVPNALNYARVRVDGDTSDLSRIGLLKERTRDTETRELQARGPNLLDELTHTNVGKLALESAPGSGLAMAAADILTAILAGTGWTATGVPSRDVYHRFGDETTLNALLKLAELTGDHLRLSRTTARRIVWLAAGADGYTPAVSGLTAKEAADPSDDACLIVGGVAMTEDGSERITRIYPRGGGNADAQLYINASTLGTSNPGNVSGDYVYGDYTLHIDAVDPWKSYIAHTVNDAAGSIGDVETIQDVAPIDDTTTDTESAANDLVLRALVVLRRRLVDHRSFRFRLGHADLSRLLEGESIRLRARAYTDAYGWFDVNEDVLILDLSTTYDGSDPLVDVQATAIQSDRRPISNGTPVQLTDRAMQRLVTAIERQQVAAAHIQPVVRSQSSSSADTIPDGSVTPPKLSHIGYLLTADVSAVTVTNTTAETSVYSYSVPGGTLGTSNKLRLQAALQVVNNSGGPATIQVKVKYGSTTIFNSTSAAMATSSGVRAMHLECNLVAAGATNAQKASTWLQMGSTVGVTGTASQPTPQLAAHDSIAEDSTAAKTLEITVTLSVASASTTAIRHTAHLELVR